jgi:hypothetical protein
MRERRELFAAGLLIVAMTVFATWPQALHMSTRVAAHQDPEFSIWRLAWIAHALARDPLHVLSANIFYPAPRTLTYSDATLLEGVVAAPLFWGGISPVTIYNLMVLGGMAASGLAAFVLARYLTGRATAALVAAAVFTMAPYRVEHFMHLELQWAMWVPLALWALHRAVDTGSWRSGVLTGLFLWLQILSCVYYGIFLAIALMAMVAVMAATGPRRLAAAVPGLAAGAALAALLTAPYMWVYLGAARDLGPRDLTEIATYSGRFRSYFSAPPQNWLWGWTASGPEVNLLLGWVAMALAFASLFHRPRRQVAMYAAVAALSIDLSLGVNTPVYRWLVASVPSLQGLRSPSRFAIIACCAVGVLAAFGARAIQEGLSSRHPRWAAAAPPGILLLLFVEYANTGMIVKVMPNGFGTVYKIMHSAGPGVLVELPMPAPDRLPGRDTDYEYWSTSHWHPLVNGYSGYYPPAYIETLERMQTFPDDESIARLRRLDVRYVIVHCRFYQTDNADFCPPLLVKIGSRPDLRPYGKYADPEGPAYLFVFDR